jgi:hypothetical protein
MISSLAVLELPIEEQPACQLTKTLLSICFILLFFFPQKI